MYFLITLSVLAANVCGQESATRYLESAIEDLRNMNSMQQNRRKLDSPTKPKIPPLALTKYDLARLYQAAINKGDSVLLDADTGSHMKAAVYEIPDGSPHKEELETDQDDTGTSGYYYYYYPLKSFVDEYNSGGSHDVYPIETYHHEVITAKPNQHHTHKHEHNVHITTTKQKVEEHNKKSKALEPLFMAISGFIGMALMFVMSALVLPKIGVLKSRGSKEPSPEMTNVIKVVFQAIEGQDCTERFACELGKTAKALNIHNNRFVKLLRRIAPTSFGKRLSVIDKYANKKNKCAFIQCKKKTKPSNKAAKLKINGKS